MTQHQEPICRPIDYLPDTLNPHYIQSLKDDSIHTVGIQFRQGETEYTYKTRLKLKDGNKVLIQNRHANYQVVTVSRIDRIPQLDRYSDINYQWVLEKVRTKKHKKHLKKDKKSIKAIELNLIVQQRKKDAKSLK